MNQPQDNITKSLKFSYLDGIFANLMTGFTSDYFTPFLLLLGGTIGQVGMLSAFPNLFSSLIQLKSADFTRRLQSRRKIINIFVFLQAIVLIPMTLIAALKGASPAAFIFLVVIFTSFGAVSLPPWSSLMSDLVDKDKRGQYFGWRNKTLGFLLVTASFLAGFILQIMKRVNVFYGFAIIFACAFIFRIISWYFLTKMYEPPVDHGNEHCFTFIQFLFRVRESNFAKFVLFVAMMNFSVNLAAPFFAVLMLRDLHFSYLRYSIITVMATLTVYATMARWGKLSDKVGNLKILKFTAPIIGIIPLLWIISRNSTFLVIAQVISGFAWAGFNLCSSNFIYDSVTPAKRTRCVSYFNVVNGLALCSGALIGGFLAPRLPLVFGFHLLSLFLISSVLRLIISLSFPWHLKEVRQVEDITMDRLFFSAIGRKMRF